MTITLELSKQDSKLALKICNQGPTIAPEQQGQIFNSMVSLRSGKKNRPHLGLGLYIVRSIVRRCSGRKGRERGRRSMFYRHPTATV